MYEERGKLRQVGSLWKPKPGSKCIGTGSITIRGYQQRFVIFENDRKASDRAPDYKIMASEEPTVDTYEADRQQARENLR